MCGYFCIAFIDVMLARKTLQIFFHQRTLKKRWYNFKLFSDQCLKMYKPDFPQTSKYVLKS